MGMEELIEATILLLIFLITFWVVLIVWQPITATGLFPLLENTEAFTYGATIILVLQVLVLVIAVLALLAFVRHIRGDGGRSQQFARF